MVTSGLDEGRLPNTGDNISNGCSTIIETMSSAGFLLSYWINIIFVHPDPKSCTQSHYAVTAIK